jgi:uncharacterized protein
MASSLAQPSARAKPKNRLLRRLIAVVVVLALIAVLIFYPAISLVGYNTLSLQPNRQLAPDDGLSVSEPFEDVTFTPRTPNGATYTVYGYYLPGDPDAPALINLHGWKASRHSKFDLSRAEGLRKLGYTVLSIDLSDNAGNTVGNGRISMGYEERYDALGAYDYLLTRGFAPDKIGIVGISMGGATALLTAALEPRIKAVWADSPYADPMVVSTEQAATFGFPTIIVPGGFIWGWVITGNKMWEARPIDQGPAFVANQQVIQLTHCDKDDFVFYHHSPDMMTVFTPLGVKADLWTIRCDLHGYGFVDYPDEYLSRLDAFFRTNLGDW